MTSKYKLIISFGILGLLFAGFLIWQNTQTKLLLKSIPPETGKNNQQAAQSTGSEAQTFNETQNQTTGQASENNTASGTQQNIQPPNTEVNSPATECILKKLNLASLADMEKAGLTQDSLKVRNAMKSCQQELAPKQAASNAAVSLTATAPVDSKSVVECLVKMLGQDAVAQMDPKNMDPTYKDAIALCSK